MNKYSRQEQQSENGLLSHNLKSYLVCIKIKRLENMCKEQETNIGQADLKINHVEYLEIESKIIEI